MALDQSQEKEAIHRAAIEENPAAGAVPGSLLERAKKIKDDLERKGPHTTIESLRPPVDKATADDNLRRAFSTELKADGTPKMSRAQEIKHADSKEFLDLANKFLSQGAESLSPAERTRVFAEVTEAIKAWPEGDEIFSEPTFDRNAALAAILLNPEFAAKLRQKVQEAIDKAKTVADSSDITETSADYETAKKDEEAANNLVDNLSREIANVDTAYSEFVPTTTPGGKGTKLKELEKLTKESPKLQAENATKQRRADRYDAEISRLEARLDLIPPADPLYTTIEASINTKTTARDSLLAEIEKNQEKIEKQEALAAEKARLEERSRALRSELLQRQTERNDKHRARLLKQVDYFKQRHDHNLSEQEVVRASQDVFSEATFEYLKEKVDEAKSENDRLREEEIKNAETDDDRNILNALDHRYVDNDRNPRKGRIDTEYEMLFRLNGAKEIFEAMYRGTNQYPPASPEYVREKARIDERLKDPDFIKKYEPRVAQEIISRRIQTGRITEQDAQFIMNSQWGQGMIEEGLRKRNDVREHVEKLVGERVIDPGFFRKLKEASGGNLILILLLLLGTGVTAGLLSKAFK